MRSAPVTGHILPDPHVGPPAQTKNASGNRPASSLPRICTWSRHGNLVLVERWATRKHYEDYLAWRQQRGDLDKLAAALAGPPSIRYFDLTSV